MTNLEKWMKYMDGFSSPDCFIQFGFYYMINACLQRRVWCGPEHAPCYPNMYVILTGEPAVGKGLVIKQVASVIKHHKMDDPKEFGTKNLPNTPVNLDIMEKPKQSKIELSSEELENIYSSLSTRICFIETGDPVMRATDMFRMDPTIVRPLTPDQRRVVIQLEDVMAKVLRLMCKA